MKPDWYADYKGDPLPTYTTLRFRSMIRREREGLEGLRLVLLAALGQDRGQRPPIPEGVPLPLARLIMGIHNDAQDVIDMIDRRVGELREAERQAGFL